jgi:transaldolase
VISDLYTKIFADGADIDWMLNLYKKPYIHGFTTNPTLMHQSGVTDYKSFCCTLLETIVDKPISFEVFSDDFVEMERQAHEISSWGNNVYVKIPVTNTKGESSCDLIQKLSYSGIKLNVTAVMTYNQFSDVYHAMYKETPSYISIFAGRIADTGIDPVPLIARCVRKVRNSNTHIIWASPRELLNIFQANGERCHVITVTNEIIKRLNLVGKDLTEFSCDTVKMFFEDGKKAGFKL